MIIASHWQKINELVTHLAHDTPVTVVAVSKHRDVASIQQAYAAGARHFGESYCQEAIKKILTFQNINDICWHFIGPIQSNKTAAIAAHFQWVQSVSRRKIALKLSEQRVQQLPALNILLQINISDDPAKSGLKPSEVDSLAGYVMGLPRLQLRGIMCIPRKTDNQQQLTGDFKQMEAIYHKLQQRYPGIDTLSMGMSNDFPLAIANGANMVRIGSALFDAAKTETIRRDPPDDTTRILNS